MKHTLFVSVDEMLAPAMFSELVGIPIKSVRCTPAEWVGYSGSRLLAIETNQGQGPRYFLKRISTERDWMMRATDDHSGREVTLWQHGLMDQLPPEITHAIIACAVDGLGWAILMQDVSEALLTSEIKELSIAQNEACLDGLAAIHATFWEQPALTDPIFGLGNLKNYFAFSSPETCRREAAFYLAHAIVDGWSLMKRVVEPDIATIVQGLLEDPQPLCDALSRYPHTLVHSDYVRNNVGVLFQPQKQVVVLDWQLAVVAPPVLDLAIYMNSTSMPIVKDAAITYYRQALARRLGTQFDEQWWQPQLDLGLLAGFFRVGWGHIMRLSYVEDETLLADLNASLAWWSERVRVGAKWL